MTIDSEVREVELRKRRVHVLGPAHEAVLRSSVQCLLRGSLGVPSCRGCARLVEETDDALVCEFPASIDRVDTPCGELVPTDTLALDSELPVRDALAKLEAAGLPSAPVVDDEAHVVGAATVLGLAKAVHDTDAEVEDVVEPTTVVNARLTVLALAHLMEDRRLERLAVVDDEEHLIGVVSVHQVLGWLRERLSGA